MTLGLAADMADWFRAQGKGHQTRINVLRKYMSARKLGEGEIAGRSRRSGRSKCAAPSRGRD